MCGRFTAAGANGRRDVRPNDGYPVATATGGTLMRWGFRFDGRLTVNARAETAPVRFRTAFSSGRCAVEVSGFYEWSPQKQAFYYTAADGDIILCALSRREQPPIRRGAFGQIGFLSDAEPEPEPEDRFVVITTAANDSVSPVHDRMPLIVDRRRLDEWLYDDGYAKNLLTARMPMPESVAVR